MYYRLLLTITAVSVKSQVTKAVTTAVVWMKTAVTKLDDSPSILHHYVIPLPPLFASVHKTIPWFTAGSTHRQSMSLCTVNSSIEVIMTYPTLTPLFVSRGIKISRVRTQCTLTALSQACSLANTYIFVCVHFCIKNLTND